MERSSIIFNKALSNEELEKVKNSFKIIDTDEDGVITISLKDLCHINRHKIVVDDNSSDMDHDDVMNMMELFYYNNHSRLDYSVFIDYMSNKSKNLISLKNLDNNRYKMFKDSDQMISTNDIYADYIASEDFYGFRSPYTLQTKKGYLNDKIDYPDDFIYIKLSNGNVSMFSDEVHSWEIIISLVVRVMKALGVESVDEIHDKIKVVTDMLSEGEVFSYKEMLSGYNDSDYLDEDEIVIPEYNVISAEKVIEYLAQNIEYRDPGYKNVYKAIINYLSKQDPNLNIRRLTVHAHNLEAGVRLDINAPEIDLVKLYSGTISPLAEFERTLYKLVDYTPSKFNWFIETV